MPAATAITPSNPAGIFRRLKWEPDRMFLDDLVFRLQHFKNEAWDLGDDCFVFYKVKPLIDQYERYFSSRREFRPQRVFELGIWDGGSVAFWHEHFQPEKHVAIDLSDRTDSDYFNSYVESRGLDESIVTRWRIDQADKPKLREVVREEFEEPLDLVIDDASHLYKPTKASFEALFPMLRPGGLYLIEDWAWDHWKEFHTPTHEWAGEVPLTKLIFDLVEAAGSSRDLIGSVMIYEGFAVVERGKGATIANGDFLLDNHILRRPKASRVVLGLRRSIRKVKSGIKKLLR